ncbi:protein kinase [Plantactinospora sp. GCM10030261]|uniref:serine/threonine-protein kinase n=1 Tax=Plantactinospora sp. GCM10030261 TaxID=3273420 RepID=UPI00360BB5B0
MQQVRIGDRYRLLQLVGSGGMGRVWLARDEMLRREVAVKEVVPPAWLAEEDRETLRDRTMREARHTARLNNPNVVRVYDVVNEGDNPWIVMEYVPSRSLHEVVTTDGPLTVERAAEIGLAVLAALRAAHAAGVLHRDVKPHNVLVADDGRVVLTDFGLARAEDDGRMTRPGMVMGSPQYVAPERAAEGVSTVEADLWSLGATLYAAVEGRSPYARRTSMATLTALATVPPDPAPHAGALRPVLDGLLRRDPRKRLGYDEVERLLRKVAGGPARPARRPAAAAPREAASREAVGAAGRTGGPDTAAGGDRTSDRSVRAGAPAGGDRTRDGARRAGAPASASGASGAEASTAAGSSARLSTEATVPGTGGTDPTGQRRTGSPGPSPPTAPDSRWRRWTLLAALLTVVTTGAVVAWQLVDRDGAGTPGPGSTGTPTLNPGGSASPGGTGIPAAMAAFRCGTPPADAARVTPAPRPSDEPYALTDGWTWYVDATAFRIAAPVGWLTYMDGPVRCFKEPEGSRVLSVDPSTPPTDRPADYLAAEERRLTGGGLLPGYEKVVIQAVDSYQGAEWECRWTNAKGMPVHAYRMLANAAGRAYTIAWQTGEFDWSVNKTNLLMVRQSFRPAP